MKKYFLLLSALTLQTNIALAFDLFNKENANRDYIYIVGSSTVSPLIAAVSEEFSRSQNNKGNVTKTPVVLSTGTREGFRLFCLGTDNKYPDFVNASRPIENSEIDSCKSNGVKNIVEFKIGYDGIVFGSLLKQHKIKLTKEHIFLALAEKIIDKKTGHLITNPYKTWREIDSNLPETKITIYGPPISSGTRDVFVDMVMETACLHKRDFALAIPNEHERKIQCHKIRSDEAFIESGENDNLIIESLKHNPDAFGIFGFNFIASNKTLIQAAAIDGVFPNPQTIASKKYPLSRPLFVYFKKDNIDSTPKIHEFVKELINKETLGKKGYLINSGLIPISQTELNNLSKKLPK